VFGILLDKNAEHGTVFLVPMLQNSYHIGSHAGAWEPGKVKDFDEDLPSRRAGRQDEF
jgi:predicted deacylase